MVNEQTLCKNGRQAILALAQNVVGMDSAPPLQAPKLSADSTYTTLATRPKMVLIEKVRDNLSTEMKREKLLEYIKTTLNLTSITTEDLEFIFIQAQKFFEMGPIIDLDFVNTIKNVEDFNRLYGNSKELEQKITEMSLRITQLSSDDYRQQTQQILSPKALEYRQIIEGAENSNEKFQERCKVFVNQLMKNLQITITISDFKLRYDDIMNIKKFVDFDVYDAIQTPDVILGFFDAYIKNVLLIMPFTEDEQYKQDLGDILEKFKLYSQKFGFKLDEALAREFLTKAKKQVIKLQEFVDQLKFSPEHQEAIREELKELEDQFEYLLKSNYVELPAEQRGGLAATNDVVQSEQIGLDEEKRLIEFNEALAQRDLDKLVTQAGKVKSQNIQINETNNALRSRIGELEFLNSKLNGEIEKFGISQSVLEQRNGALGDQVEKQQETIGQLEKKITELTEKNQQLEVQARTIEELQGTISELRGTNRQLQVQNTQLGASSQNVEQMIQQLTIKENEKNKYQRMWKQSTKSLEKFAETYDRLTTILS